mgnify:CR=1 FL=1
MSLTIFDVTCELKVSNETVRRWIVDKKLAATFSPDHGRYEIEAEDLEDFCAHSQRYRYKAPVREKIKQEEPETMRNSEGYPDPTAALAMRQLDRDYRFGKLIYALLTMIDLAGFQLENRMVLVDKKTGKTYR